MKRLTDGVERILRSLLVQLPQIGLGLVILIVFVLLARLAERLAHKSLGKATDRSDSFLNVMSRLVRSAVVVIGVIIALMVALPGVNLATVIGGLGIGTVALGFAFKDIAQNTLAGLLLLFRRPFRVGDQIEVQKHTGTVEDITIRETRLKTFAGQRILIPNSDVYTSAVRVQTAYEVIRSEIVVGVDYSSDLARARETALTAARSVAGVVEDPAPEAHYTTLNHSTVDFDLQYWTRSAQAEVRAVKGRVVEAVVDALNDAGIGLPANVVELDARVSFAEAVRQVRGEGFQGIQNGQSQREPLARARVENGSP